MLVDKDDAILVGARLCSCEVPLFDCCAEPLKDAFLTV